MDSKIVTVPFGIFNNPNTRKIEKAINKWGKKGYRLVNQSDDKPGSFTMLFSGGLARGKTTLTFVKDD